MEGHQGRKTERIEKFWKEMWEAFHTQAGSMPPKQDRSYQFIPEGP